MTKDYNNVKSNNSEMSIQLLKLQQQLVSHEKLHDNFQRDILQAKKDRQHLLDTIKSLKVENNNLITQLDVLSYNANATIQVSNLKACNNRYDDLFDRANECIEQRLSDSAKCRETLLYVRKEQTKRIKMFQKTLWNEKVRLWRLIDHSHHNITLCGNLVLLLSDEVKSLKVIPPRTESAIQLAQALRFHDHFTQYRNVRNVQESKPTMDHNIATLGQLIPDKFNVTKYHTFRTHEIALANTTKSSPIIKTTVSTTTTTIGPLLAKKDIPETPETETKINLAIEKAINETHLIGKGTFAPRVI